MEVNQESTTEGLDSKRGLFDLVQFLGISMAATKKSLYLKREIIQNIRVCLSTNCSLPTSEM